MANTVEMNQQELAIQGLIGQYLAVSPRNQKQTSHLDQDTLTAFVEGVLTRQSGENAVRHLVDCSHCRHISAELIRLDLEFAESVPAETVTTQAPTSISAVLSGLFSKIFGTADGAVFAHTENEKDEKDSADSDEKPKE